MRFKSKGLISKRSRILRSFEQTISKMRKVEEKAQEEIKKLTDEKDQISTEINALSNFSTESTRVRENFERIIKPTDEEKE